jgi:hypothetical protein
VKSKLATWEAVKCIDLGARSPKKKAAILHSAVTNASDLFAYWSTCPGTGAQFYINEAGKLFQYVDSDHKCAHAWDANDWAIGIETWDGAQDPIPRWNDAQITTIVALLKELGIPAQSLKEQASDGVGYHRQFPSWNKSGHTCPGDARVAQVDEIIELMKEDDLSAADVEAGIKAAFELDKGKGDDAVLVGDLLVALGKYLAKDAKPTDARRGKMFDSLVAKLGPA